MYCQKCGADIKEGSKFCVRCGFQVPDTQVQEVAEPKQCEIKAEMKTTQVGIQSVRLSSNNTYSKMEKQKEVKEIYYEYRPLAPEPTTSTRDVTLTVLSIIGLVWSVCKIKDEMGLFFVTLWGIAKYIILFTVFAVLIIVFLCRLADAKDRVKPSLTDDFKKQIHDERILNNGGWRCTVCGRVNPPYCKTCSCGNTKHSNEN